MPRSRSITSGSRNSETTRRRAAIGSALLVLCGVFAATGSVHGEPRKSQHRSNPASKVHTAPDVTGTIAPSATKVPASPPVADVLTPYYLPAAPRPVMRACGEKWQRMKMAGEVADLTWRDFATKCLTESKGTVKAVR
jgi:hypothetical protein